MPSDPPVQLEWADPAGAAVPLDGGEIAGALSVLAPGYRTASGGAIAEAAESYNKFASAPRTDASTPSTTVGRTGQPAPRPVDFFTPAPPAPPRSGITGSRRAPPTSPSRRPERARWTPASRTRSPSSAPAPGSPDKLWSGIVTGIGVQSRGAQQHEALTTAAQASALTSRASQASVSLDEENVSLLTNQHAYQAAARVMTAVDEALDVLINRTGLVGR